MTDYFREPTEQEAEKMFAKIMDGEVERQSYATFTANNGPMPGNGEPLTLAKLEETMRRAKEIVGKEPLDTHIFSSAGGRQWINAALPVRKIDVDWLSGARVKTFMGLEVWDDMTVPSDEIQMGYLRWESSIVDDQRVPHKVVTKTFKIV